MHHHWPCCPHAPSVAGCSRVIDVPNHAWEGNLWPSDELRANFVLLGSFDWCAFLLDWTNYCSWIVPKIAPGSDQAILLDWTNHSSQVGGPTLQEVAQHSGALWAFLLSYVCPSNHTGTCVQYHLEHSIDTPTTLIQLLLDVVCNRLRKKGRL